MSIAMSLQAKRWRDADSVKNPVHVEAAVDAAPQAGHLHARLLQRIHERGPMPFRDWMDACLYDPEAGFYTAPGRSPTGVGPAADFATNPTLHPFFARCVAHEIRAALHASGPEGFHVYEFGGGRGDLARDALAAMAAQDATGTDPMPGWVHIEAGAQHRTQQSGAGIVHAPDIPAGASGVVVAHEFLDALPVHLLQRTQDGWSEMAVDADGAWTTVEAVAGAVALAPEVPAGTRVAVSVAAHDWLHHVARRLEKGRILIVDYGDDDVWHRDLEWGTVRTFRGHAEAGSPLEAPGTKDITASIDFAALRQWADEAGLDVVSEESQEGFLLRHGVLDALNAQERDSVEGASRYLRLRQMLIPHAGGMGDAFRVLVLEKGSG